jgi:hypothetical protein
MRTLMAAALLTLPLLADSTKDERPSAPPEGFVALFDGKSLKGWKLHGGKEGAWAVDEKSGTLYTARGGGGWIMSEKEYANFELRVDFKVPSGGNSGVALRSPMKGDPAYTGMEIQILDDKHPSYKKIKDFQRTGSIYGVVPSSSQPTKPTGEWNTYRIVCKGKQVTVELNGVKIVDANLADHEEKHGKAHPGILRTKGHVGFQEHGGRIELRNIFIKELE